MKRNSILNNPQVMQRARIVFILTIICSFFVTWSDAKGSEHVDLGTVIFANILYRHGDRTPVDPYPNDPYGDESLWPVPFGQLTNLGKEQHLMLGRWLRKRYAHLLSQSYTPYDIYVMSTDVDRTLMSAEANLAGLYPPRGDQVWDKLRWMPIPVHTRPEIEDWILASKKYCPRYDSELDKVQNSEEFKKIYRDNKELFLYLTTNSGRVVKKVIDVEEIYNTLFIENLYNRTLPEWTKSVFPDKMKPLADLSFAVDAYNKVLQRLKRGPLLGEMVDHIVKKSEGTLYPDRKLWIYSAHDETVATFLMTLNLFEYHAPPYTATVFMELRVNSLKEHIVTISYKNTSGEPTLLTLPGCTVACPLKNFVQLTKDIIPTNWEDECALDWEDYGQTISATSIVEILTAMVLVLILLVLLIVGFVYWHHSRDSNRYYLKLTTDPN